VRLAEESIQADRTPFTQRHLGGLPSP
jgi:hypothetical protein